MAEVGTMRVLKNPLPDAPFEPIRMLTIEERLKADTRRREKAKKQAGLATWKKGQQKKTEKEVGKAMSFKKVISRDQVMAYMCGLVGEYGDHPTQVQARAYSQANHTLIFPKNAIDVLGAKDWDEVVAIYAAEMHDTESLPTEIQEPLESPKPSKQKKQASTAAPRKGKRYNKEEVLEILKELWQEMDGRVTQSKLAMRAKTKPTPSWSTLLYHLGPSSNWKNYFAPEVTMKKPIDAVEEANITEPEHVETGVVEPITEDPLPVPAPVVSLELKISMPGMPAPIVMEFTVK